MPRVMLELLLQAFLMKGKSFIKFYRSLSSTLVFSSLVCENDEVVSQSIKVSLLKHAHSGKEGVCAELNAIVSCQYVGRAKAGAVIKAQPKVTSEKKLNATCFSLIYFVFGAEM